jgi:hypothetical protein
MDRYARVSLADDRLVYVQLLLYGLDMKAPTAADARAWAEHYRMDRSKNRVVLAGTSEFVNDASYAMIPGFQLVDKNFILRAESSGHRPRHDLYRELLPMIPQLLH